MRYHFNVRDGCFWTVIPDREGSEFASLKAAGDQARATVRALAIEDIRNGNASGARRVEISNRDGAVLDSVNLNFSENWIRE